ncbi:hypothetical protein ACSX1A_05380 [Pontibacter sp. MBLB2868]|uniref:hypothetical protein n=1 Tax=Pontibacter sp. MBLB2868 TaxID=3451555 RepID=UPI003F74DB22
MRHILILILIVIPYFSFAQDIKVKVGATEFLNDKVPDQVVFPEKVKKISIKKVKADRVPATYVVQIGEEEHKFKTDGEYHEIEFSHDIRGLVVYILNDKRNVQGKPFILKKAK